MMTAICAIISWSEKPDLHKAEMDVNVAQRNNNVAQIDMHIA